MPPQKRREAQKREGEFTFGQPYADLGGMVRENAAAINFGMMAPIYPATAIALLTVSVNLVVDWMLSIDARPSGAQAEL